MIGQRGLPATFGGIEHHVEEIAVRLAERGHEMVVFCRRNYSDPRQRVYRGVRLIHPPTYPSKHLEAALHSGLSSLATIGKGFDIVHYHAIGPGIWSFIPRGLSGAKVVQTIHGLDQKGAKWGRFARAVLGLGAWLSKHVPDGVVLVASHLTDSYEGRNGTTVHIPNGVNQVADRDDRVLNALGLRAGEYLLFVGRLVPEKGVDHLIRSFAQVPTPYRLVIVGGSSYTDDYEVALKQLASADPRVVLPGYLYGAELASLYSHAALYVQPSLREGFPLTVLEALCYGRPVVLSDIPAHVEVLQHANATARLYRAGNTESLRLALEETLAAAGSRQDGAGRVTAARVMSFYDWESIVDRTEELYGRLVSR